MSGQGFTNPTIPILLPADETGHPENFIFFQSVERLTVFYRDLLEGAVHNNQEFFFYFGQLKDQETVVAALRKVELDFSLSNPRLYGLLQRNIDVRKKLDLLNRQYISAQTELDNYKQYLEILRSGHQAEEIQDFYTREYEVLPLWYKRFGHIPEVLTGRRTLRSLFRTM